MKTVYMYPERCLGCRQCEYACAVAHSQSKDAVLALTEHPPPRSRIHISTGRTPDTSFPIRCRHCNPAPCEQVCPTGAMARDAEHDLVHVNIDKCIACAMCAMVCPFDAVTFHAQMNGMPLRIVATKCDGCVERLDDGRVPACVEACKTGALRFGELNDLVAAGWRAQAEASTTLCEEI
jgi:carbon-monoxide dehydrogenase iron sulfur subunit